MDSNENYSQDWATFGAIIEPITLCTENSAQQERFVFFQKIETNRDLLKNACILLLKVCQRALPQGLVVLQIWNGYSSLASEIAIKRLNPHV